MNPTRPTLQDIEQAFNDLPCQGPRVEYVEGRVRAEGNFSHIQGVVATGGHYVLAHADQHRESGRWLVAGRTDKSQSEWKLSGWSEVLAFTDKLHEPFLPHAGGCQRLGDLLIVACETIRGDKHSALAFFDVSSLGQPSELEGLRIPRPDKAMAAGLTTYTRDGSTNYLAAAYEHGKVDFYSSNGLNGRWSKTGQQLTVDEKNHQAFLLLTDAENRVFAIGLNHGNWPRYSNEAILYRVHFDKGRPVKLEEVAKKTFATHEGAALRWGASIEVEQQGTRTGTGTETGTGTRLVLYCTGRRFDEGRCVLNVFDPNTPDERRAKGRGATKFYKHRPEETRPRARRPSTKRTTRTRRR